MIEAILAIDENYGIGYKNTLPWKCKADLKLFREKTLNKVIVAGRKTAQYLPYLKDRDLVCLSKDPNLDTSEWNNIVVSIENNLEKFNCNDFIIIGGAEIFSQALLIDNFVHKIHLSVIKGVYECDTFVKKEIFDNYLIESSFEEKEFTHYTMIYNSNKGEKQYIDMLKNILKNGKKRKGRNGLTKSLFNYHLKFNLQNGFPLLTTKKMFTRGIIEEFLFFVRGQTDTTILSDKKVRIWEGNTTSDFLKSRNLDYAQGVMGPLYGYQWRYYNSIYTLDENKRPVTPNNGFNQIEKVIYLIKNDPYSRRILLSSYNPIQAEEGVLYPCHSLLIQFYVDEDFLDMTCYNRSQDTFLGTPYNIASSSLLLSSIAKITNKKPRWLYMNLGDVHIYEGHEEAVKTQIKRLPYKFSTLVFPNIESLDDLCNLKAKDFEIINYKSHSKIKADMVA